MKMNQNVATNATQTTAVPMDMLALPDNYGERLSPQMQNQVRNLVSSINIMNKDFVSSYGAEQQTTLGKFADSMLEGQSSKAIGETGELLNQAMNQINGYDMNCEPKGFLAKLISNPKKRIEQIRDNYKSVDKKIEVIVQELSRKQQEISRVYDEFESLFVSNKETYEYLTIFIYAGQVALEEEKKKLADMQEDPNADPQDVRDYDDAVNRFDKRLYDLKLTRAIAISLAPQIRTVQKSAQQVNDTIKTAINTSIPLWKTQMAMALGIKTVQAGLDAANQVNDVTNRMFLSVSEAGKNLAIESAKANQKGVIDIETIRKVNQNLIESFAESTKITTEAIETRKKNSEELKQLETDLITAIRNIK